MNKFSDSIENDSFDDILATIDVPTAAIASSSSQAKGASPAKKQRLSSFDNDDDDLLANVVMPEATTSTNQTTKPTNVPISAGKTNCVLVNPKQRGTNRLTIMNYLPKNKKISFFFRQSNSQIDYKCSMGIR